MHVSFPDRTTSLDSSPAPQSNSSPPSQISDLGRSLLEPVLTKRLPMSKTLNPASPPRGASLGATPPHPPCTPPLHPAGYPDSPTSLVTGFTIRTDATSPPPAAFKLTASDRDGRLASNFGLQLEHEGHNPDHHHTQDVVDNGSPPPPRRSSADFGVRHARTSLFLGSVVSSSITISQPLASTSIPPSLTVATTPSHLAPLPQLPASLDSLPRANLERLCQLLYADGLETRQAAQAAEEQFRNTHKTLGKLSTQVVQALRQAQRHAIKDKKVLHAKEREVEDLRQRLGQVLTILSTVLPGLVPGESQAGEMCGKMGGEPKVGL